MSRGQKQLTSGQPNKKKRGCFFYGALFSGLGLLIFFGGVFAAVWWIQRPIDPVELSASEKKVVLAKVESLQSAADPRYETGKRRVSFTEHELNGLLNQHTEFGEKVKFEIDQDALSAYLVHKLPDESPIFAGRTLKGRANLEIVYDQQEPVLRVKDLTVYGISVPSAWLGGIKDRNLARDLFGGSNQQAGAFLKGIKNLKLENGRIDLELNE